MSSTEEFTAALKKAHTYGLGEFLEIIGELSQVSTRKGALDRKSKELITLGIALAKQCNRCIQIHTNISKNLGATKKEISKVRKVALFMNASPEGEKELWESWMESWKEFAISKNLVKTKRRELIALGIALVRQSKKHINFHAANALSIGTPAAEILEVMPIVLLMDGAPAVSQIPRLLKAVELDDKAA
jgi:AhpD family alkylhydroperoxidase